MIFHITQNPSSEGVFYAMPHGLQDAESQFPN